MERFAKIAQPLTELLQAEEDKEEQKFIKPKGRESPKGLSSFEMEFEQCTSFALF